LKKRKLSAIIGKYSNFQHVAISFDKMYSKKDIENMFYFLSSKLLVWLKIRNQKLIKGPKIYGDLAL